MSIAHACATWFTGAFAIVAIVLALVEVVDDGNARVAVLYLLVGGILAFAALCLLGVIS